ncbi:MAG TPA: ABC transporter permease subunit, partial [Polyangia bacterium]|nr:ABC transporter permease subunit [Polyangia bacterium]
MKLGEVLLVAGKELRETLRDRRTLAVMILFPLVVYPLVSLATVQVLAARIGRSEKAPARVVIAGPPALADKLRARLAARNRDGSEEFAFPAGPATAEEVRGGRVDAAVVLASPAGAAAGAPSARILFDETQERSRTARERVEKALSAGAERDCAAAYAVTAEGVAPRKAMGGYLLSKILPLVIIVMVMLGAFHPAIDITAGERERGTLETTLSAPIARASLMTGK